MGEKIERELERFEVKTEDGREMTLIALQTFIDVTHNQSKGQEWIAGLRRWQLEDGLPVNCIDDNTFKIVSTGEIVRKM